MNAQWQRPGVVDCGGDVFASCCRGFSCSFACSMDSRISTAAPLALVTSDDCKARLVRFRPCKTRYIRIPGFSFSFIYSNSFIYSFIHLFESGN